MMVKIGPITIGRDDRPWIVRQIEGLRELRWQRLAPRSAAPARPWLRWVGTLGPYTAALAGGMLIAYAFDPGGGRRRRAIGRERAAAALHRARRRLTRLGRATGARSRAVVGRATHLRFTMPTPVDDVVLVDRVKAVLFREHDFPKGRISIGAANGSVALRGEVERYEQIDQIESIVWGVAGVSEVENLLHVPGTAAPNTIGATQRAD